MSSRFSLVALHGLAKANELVFQFVSWSVQIEFSSTNFVCFERILLCATEVFCLELSPSTEYWCCFPLAFSCSGWCQSWEFLGVYLPSCTWAFPRFASFDCYVHPIIFRTVLLCSCLLPALFVLIIMLNLNVCLTAYNYNNAVSTDWLLITRFYGQLRECVVNFLIHFAWLGLLLSWMRRSNSCIRFRWIVLFISVAFTCCI